MLLVAQGMHPSVKGNGLADIFGQFTYCYVFHDRFLLISGNVEKMLRLRFTPLSMTKTPDMRNVSQTQKKPVVEKYDNGHFHDGTRRPMPVQPVAGSDYYRHYYCQ